MSKTSTTRLTDWREHFEERAAIMEFDGGIGRRDAERIALKSVAARMGFGVDLPEPAILLALTSDDPVGTIYNRMNRSSHDSD